MPAPPLITRFFLYFATRDGGLRSVESLRVRGFEAETSLGWDDPFWITVASRQLANEDLEHADQQMRELVASLGGDYGGFDQRPAPLPPAA